LNSSAFDRLHQVRARAQRRRAFRNVVLGIGLCSVFLSGAASATGEAERGADLRPRMHEVYAALEKLLPLTRDRKLWADPARRADIEANLARLEKAAGAVESHAETRDQSFMILSRSLSAELADVKNRFDLGRLEESRFLLMQATSNCVACHERLPAKKDSPMGAALLEAMDVEDLPVYDRIHSQLVTRQFDAAMNDLEAAMVDPRERPQDLDFAGSLVDYLTVGIRVKRDPDRVIRHLKQFAARADLPHYLRNHVEEWIADLQRTKQLLDSKKPLADARKLVRRSPPSEARPLSRDATVTDLVASSLLLRFIDSMEGTARERAEAFYLLGVAESRGIDSPWIPQAATHLEMAIRLAPDAPFAESAYLALEESLYLDYGGVSGETPLPIDISTKLEELRDMVEADDEDDG
jgi:hypothetical protein